jgi:uncharacterized membrane protein
MTDTHLVWAAAGWAPVAVGFFCVLLALLVAGYWRTGGGAASPGVRAVALTLKAAGVLILVLCLCEPRLSSKRARPGENSFVVLADNSQSMTLKDAPGGVRAAGDARGDLLKAAAKKDSPWLAQIGRDFDLRQFAFDSQLKAVENFDSLTFDGRSSDLGAALERLLRRYDGRPLAGVLLFTDGGATDADAVDRVLARAKSGGLKVPPLYPVLVGQKVPPADVSVDNVTVSQTNFEDAPVTVAAQIAASGYAGRPLTVDLLDEAGQQVERQTVRVEREGEPAAVRFRFKPAQPGLSFYRVRAAAEGEESQFQNPATTAEATLANNTRMTVVDRGRGPYRVLYVAGRPNWEYKFLQRSEQADDQVQLVGMIRVAKREPKFNFLGRPGDRANPLFRGFDKDRDETEQYDQPVLVRLNTVDETELKGGFPKTAEELYKYHAVILDDLEAEFFTQDQLQLLKDFVRQRGGGLLMLGGQESFKNGNYDRTPVGDILPVYADQAPVLPSDARYRLALTREGWLEPWVRLRSEEQADQQRLEGMPDFMTLNTVRGIKPGATVLARVAVNGGDTVPALVEQRFGQGRVGALLVGDLWRWELRRPNEGQTDFEKAWRQTVRWLVADVPQRVEIAVNTDRGADDAEGSVRLAVTVRDPAYAPLDNAALSLRVTGPDGKTVDLRAEPSTKEPGRYEALFVARDPGPYRVAAAATAPDGADVGKAQAGWTADPAAEEFRDLQPNAALLDRIAKGTGGEVVRAGDLAAFAASLPTRHAEITEPFEQPFWHQSWVFLLAIACLVAEWGLRRVRGLP